MLTIVETHPVQYHAPVYRAVHLRYGIPVRVVYGSDFSVAGYRDREFGASFAWDVDLLAGYESMFVSRGSDGGPGAFEQVSSRGLKKTLEATGNGPILLLGYSGAFHRAAFLHSALNRRAILFRAETTDHARSRRPITRLARDQVLRTVYRRCTRLLYIGRRSADHYRRILGSDEKLVFSPYCVDVTPFQLGEASRARLREEVRSELDLRGRHVVLFSGKLTSRKGVDGLLQAVKRMDTAERRLLAVVFVGDGELRAALQSQAASSPSVDVRFVGFRNQRELSRYYHAADLLVLPSRHSETWGLVVNEALHHGLPCVVTRAVGCAPDLVEPGVTGEIVETGSPEDLKDGLLRGLTLAGRADVRDRCREKIAAYTVDRAAEGIARAYQDVVN